MVAVRDLLLNLKERREGHAMLEAARDLDKLSHGADAAGDSFARMRSDAQRLDAQIVHTKDRIKDLNVQFARTGDKSLFGDISAAERDLKRLEKAFKAITPAANVTNDFGGQLGEAFGGLKGTAKPALIAGLVGAAAAAAPTIGAMLGGAIAGAAGTGAMAAGIFAASKDQRVRDAASAFGQDISAEFFGAGASFVEPVIKSLDILRKGFAGLHLGDQLAKVAPDVEVIAQGFADAGREFMEGFGPALDRMGPLAKVGADYITDFGEALGEALDNITKSKGTVEGLETLLALLTGTIRGVGVALEWLGNGFHRFNRLEAEVFGGLEDAFKTVGLDQFSAGAARLNDVFERMTGTGENLHGVLHRIGDPSTDPFADYLKHSQEEMARLHEETLSAAGALEDFWRQVNKADDANVSWERALDNLTEGVKENGRSLDITTEAGRRNHENVEAAIRAAQEQYEVNIAAGMSAQQAGQQFAAEARHIEDVGVKAGLARAELDKLVGKYIITVAVSGLNSIAAAVYNAFYRGGTSAIQLNTGRPMKEYAVGGDTPAFEPFRVHAGEVLWSNRQQYVSTAAQSQALLSGASGGSATPVVISFAATGDSLLDALLRELKTYIRVNGGTASDSVQTALGY